MTETDKDHPKKPYGKMIFFGVFSLTLYIIVFTHQDMVMEYFSRGKWYAALPVITAFIFSFVHGAFASHLISVMGLEAKK
ncbi:hypothetical protein KJ693_07605 [bacterium]|nr:hypothetical protein [bacterium]MBU1615164.1 hypothetical protein [bacterium]